MTCGITLNDEDYWFQNLWFEGFIPELKMSAIEIFNSDEMKQRAVEDELKSHWPGKVYDLDNDSINGVTKHELRLVFLRALRYEQSVQSGPGPYDNDIDRLVTELSKCTVHS